MAGRLDAGRGEARGRGYAACRRARGGVDQHQAGPGRADLAVRLTGLAGLAQRGGRPAGPPGGRAGRDRAPPSHHHHQHAAAGCSRLRMSCSQSARVQGGLRAVASTASKSSAVAGAARAVLPQVFL